jgi:hypothetical protein
MATIIKIGADTRPEQDAIELYEHKFMIRRVTRSVQKGLEAVDKKLRALDAEADGDKIVPVMAEGLDALLEPNGGGVPAKKVIVDLWKDETLSLDEINQLYEAVQENAAKRPPTSAPAT